MASRRRTPRQPRQPSYGQPTVPHPTTMPADTLNPNGPSNPLSITCVKSAQSSVSSYHDDRRVTHSTPKRTNPVPITEDSLPISPSLQERVKNMERKLSKATKMLTEISHHFNSSSSHIVRDSHINPLLNILDIDLTSVYSFGLMSIKDIIG
jgi:hypothetical protein